MSINVAKWTFFLSLCVSRITSFLLFTLFNCQAGIVSSFFSIPCPLLLSPPKFSSLEASEEMCEPSCNESLNCTLSQQCDFHDLSVEMIPTVVLLFTKFNCHAGILSSFSHSLSTAASASGFFFACGIGTNLCAMRCDLQ